MEATAEAERRSTQFVVTTSVPSKGEAEIWLLIVTRGGDDERKEGECPSGTPQFDFSTNVTAIHSSGSSENSLALVFSMVLWGALYGRRRENRFSVEWRGLRGIDYESMTYP